MSGIIMPPASSGGGVSVVSADGTYPGYPYTPTGISGRFHNSDQIDSFYIFDNAGDVIEPYFRSSLQLSNYSDDSLFLSSSSLTYSDMYIQKEISYIVISGVPHIIITAYNNTGDFWGVYKVRVTDADVTLLYTLRENDTDLSASPAYSTQRLNYFDDAGTLHLIFASRRNNVTQFTMGTKSQHITIAEDGTVEKFDDTRPPYTAYRVPDHRVSTNNYIYDHLTGGGFGSLGGCIQAPDGLYYGYETDKDNQQIGLFLGFKTQALPVTAVNKNYYKFNSRYGKGDWMTNLVKREDYRAWLTGVRKYLTGR